METLRNVLASRPFHVQIDPGSEMRQDSDGEGTKNVESSTCRSSFKSKHDSVSFVRSTVVFFLREFHRHLPMHSTLG